MGFQRFGVPTSSVLALTLLVFAMAPGTSVVGTPDDGDAHRAAEEPTEEQLLQWFESLGAPSWQERENATTRFLDAGHVVVPFLRTHEDSPDPEVAARIAQILTVLDPARARVHIVRLAEPTPRVPGSNAGWSIQEWATVDVTEDLTAKGETQRIDTGPVSRVEVSLVGETDIFHLFAELDIEDDLSRSDHTLTVGGVDVISEEDRLEFERIDGHWTRKYQSGLWVLWLEGKPKVEAVPERADLRESLAAAVEIQFENLDPDAIRQALRIARRLPEVTTPEAEQVPQELDPYRQLLRVHRGESAAMATLEAWLGRSEEGVETEVLHEVALGLTEAGSPFGLTKLLAGMGNLENFDNYRTIKALVTCLDRTQNDPERRAKVASEILQTVCDPRIFSWMPWSYIETPYLLQRLEECAPPADFRQAMIALLPEGLGDHEPYGGTRTNALLSAFLRIRAQEPVETEVWFEPMRELLQRPQAREALLIIRQARIDGTLPDKEWHAALDEIIGMVPEDPSRASHINNTLKPLVSLPELPVDDLRRVWKARLSSFTINSSIRSQVDKELETLFTTQARDEDDDDFFDDDDVERKRPGRNEDEKWLARRPVWEKYIDHSSEERLRGRTATAGPDKKEDKEEDALPTHVRLTEIEFRTADDKSTMRVFRQREVEVGRAYIECGPDVSDRTTLITAPSKRSRRWSLANRRSLELGRPSLARSKGLHRYYRNSSAFLGPRSIRGEKDIRFEALYLLEDPESAFEATSWPGLLDEVVAALPTMESEDRKAWLDIVRRLNRTEVLPALRELYDKEKDFDIARALLALGDPVGRDAMIEQIRTFEGKNLAPAVELLETLMNTGDPVSFDIALDWLIEVDNRIKRHIPRIIQLVVRSVDEGTVEVPDQDKLYEALIASLDHRYAARHAIPLLEKLTGRDFGSRKLREARRSDERAKIEKQISAECRKWFDEYRKSSRND